MNFYADPRHAGWRGNMARAHRAWCAGLARTRRKDARARKAHNARMDEIINARKKKR